VTRDGKKNKKLLFVYLWEAPVIYIIMPFLGFGGVSNPGLNPVKLWI